MPATIEVELRSFIDEKQYAALLQFFKAKGTDKGQSQQETIYFDGKHDVRIQQSVSEGKKSAKIWMKGGKLHDDAREEIEVPVVAADFEKLSQLFAALGYKESIRWQRTRNTFIWNGITVTVDFSKGYGYILELEQMSTSADKAKTLAYLNERFASLEIPVTPKATFEKKYTEYKKNWRKLLR